MIYNVRLHDERGKFVGEVPVSTSPGLLRFIKVRFEGECSGSPPPLFGGEKWFVRDRDTLDFHAFDTNATEFVEVKDILLAEPRDNVFTLANVLALDYVVPFRLIPPQSMRAAAQQVAQQILALPLAVARDERLNKLRTTNPTLYPLVKAHVESCTTRAQVVPEGGADPITPERMIEAADELVKQIYGLPDHEMREALARLRAENPTMHALVTSRKDNRPPGSPRKV